MRSLALFLFAATAFAAVDGTVLNRTTGKPQPTAIVTLMAVGPGGMKPAGSSFTDAQGKFRFDATPEGPAIVQVAWQGVTYNQQIPPGAPATGLEIAVYNATKEPAKASHHIVILEPAADQLRVTESFVFNNDTNLAHHDPDGMLRFYLPKEAQPPTVMATGPQGMPIQREARTRENGVYTVDFPIRPGETRFDIRYTMPFTSPGIFASRNYYKDIPTRIFVPTGVNVTGDGVKPLGSPDPRVVGFEVAQAAYKVGVEGTGAIENGQDTGAAGGDEDGSGPRIEQIMPRVYNRLAWILASTLVALLLGFILLYRKGANIRA